MSIAEWLTVAQASTQTGIPKRTLQWAISQGRLAAEKLAGNTGPYVLQQRDLDEYVAAKRNAQASA
jgi:excisionase family DNA binding protein